MNKTLFCILSSLLILSVATLGAATVTIPDNTETAHGTPDDSKIAVDFGNSKVLEYNQQADVVVTYDDDRVFILPSDFVAPESGISSQGITGAIVTPVEGEDSNAPYIILIALVTLGLFFLMHTNVQTPVKVVMALVGVIAILFSIPMLNTPTGNTIYGTQDKLLPQGVNPGLLASDCFLVSIGINSYTICPDGAIPKQCSDTSDNDGDGLTDCDDPGCHTDGDASNASSCNPNDDFEQDMLEYDHPPIIDNEIDVYDIVNWIQYFNGDTTVLINCVNPSCSGAGATCVGDADANNDAVITTADITFLQTTQLNEDDSTTVPVASPICFNP